MKKTFCVITSVLLAAVTASAQLKVDSTGKVSINRTGGTAYSTLCLGNYAPSATEMAHYQRGIGCSIQTLTKSFNVGVTSSVHASPGFNSHRAIGMLGIADVRSKKETILDKGFSVELGGTLDIDK